MDGVGELLAGWGIETFAHAGRLAWLLPLAALGILALARRRPRALDWPDLPEARAGGARRFDPVRAFALVARAAALAVLALVLAGPVGVHRAPPEPGHGLDMTLVVDASGSMRALDALIEGDRRTRLDLAREVVARFAAHRAAEGDRVALVVFGEHAFTQCPLTSDGDLLATALARVEPGMAGEATALGDALSLAVKRALGGGKREADRGDEPGAGRLVVLLTDGRHNAGRVSVESALELALAGDVRVHTVAIGSAGEEVAMQGRGRAGAVRYERHDVDPDTLRRVADATGGRFFAARRSADLERVYAEIDRLERVVRTLPPRVRHTERPEPLLAAAGGLLLAELGVARVLRRRVP